MGATGMAKFYKKELQELLQSAAAAGDVTIKPPQAP
jgi:hypothetical protein